MFANRVRASRAFEMEIRIEKKNKTKQGNKNKSMRKTCSSLKISSFFFIVN